jgi:hypothetical protein
MVEVAMGEKDDDNVIYPLTGNYDLRAARLVPEDDDDIREDAAALLGIDVGSGSLRSISTPATVVEEPRW